MIILDTHIWIWWNDKHPNLTIDYENVIQQNLVNGIGVSAISCWEIAKLYHFHLKSVHLASQNKER